MEKSICFISRYAHHALIKGSDKKIGGAEFQQAVIARALRERGWTVEFITEKFSSSMPVIIDGIKIFGGLDFNIGLRMTRRFIHLPMQLRKLMDLSEAHIFYQRNPGMFSFLIGIYSRLKGKRFVLSGASDANFDRNNELNVNSFIDKADIKYGIKLANKIILQNMQQQKLLKSNYGRTGTTFYNIYNPPASFKSAKIDTDPKAKQKILWIGRLSSEKRPELCIKLAHLLSEYTIVVLGAREPSASRQPTIDVTEASRSIPNLLCLGHLPVEEVETQLDAAQGLINTSYVEGFPNTFLQAWSRGIPVFSFVEPDNIISDNGLGCRVDTIEEMAVAIRRSLDNRTLYMHQAKKIKNYFTQNFSVSKRITILEDILLDND